MLRIQGVKAACIHPESLSSSCIANHWALPISLVQKACDLLIIYIQGHTSTEDTDTFGAIGALSQPRKLPAPTPKIIEFNRRMLGNK